MDFLTKLRDNVNNFDLSEFTDMDKRTEIEIQQLQLENLSNDLRTLIRGQKTQEQAAKIMNAIQSLQTGRTSGGKHTKRRKAKKGGKKKSRKNF